VTHNLFADPNFWLGMATGWGAVIAACAIGFYLYCLYEYLFK
jgi:hypothetical protein